MRLAYIAVARIPSKSANSLQIMKMCEAFAKTDFDVELIVPPYWVGEADIRKKDPFRYYDVERIFKIVKLPMTDVFLLKPASGSIWWLNTLKRVRFVLFTILSLTYLMTRPFNFVFTRDPMVAFFASFFKQTVYECHTYSPSRMIRIFERLSLSRCKFTVAISQTLKRHLVERGFDEMRTYVLHDAVSPQILFAEFPMVGAKKELGIDIDQKIVVYTGHLYQRNGVYTLAEAAAFLKEKVFLVGGRQEDIEAFKHYISEKNINNILVVGHRTPRDVMIFQRAADVLVLPLSATMKRNIFASPLKLFEYMASRKPIVASRLPGITEILNERNAILVEADTPRKLAEGINKALTNKQLSKRIADQAYQNVRLNTWENRAAKICALLNSRRINASSARHKPSYSRGLDRKTV